MISVLIPIYNYNVTPLIYNLHELLVKSKVPFEILGFEDGSKTSFVKKNNDVAGLPYTSLLVSEENLGRIKARQILCEKAKYDWLLFLDADTIPKNEDFITVYLNIISEDYDAIFGGIYYEKQKPHKDNILRWKYGQEKEEVKAAKRMLAQYKHVVSANMLIKKSLFKDFNSEIKVDSYGMDSYFGLKLKKLEARIIHIDNEVFHLGIEKSIDFLNKKEEASETLLRLLSQNKTSFRENHLLNVFKVLKRYKLNYLFSLIYMWFKTILKTNLLGANPSIKLLQLYRISYMCNIDLKKR